MRALLGRPAATLGLLLLAAVLGLLTPVLDLPCRWRRRRCSCASPSGPTSATSTVARSCASRQRWPPCRPSCDRVHEVVAAAHPGTLRSEIADGYRVALASGETGLVLRVRHPDEAVARTAVRAAADAFVSLRRDRLRRAAAQDVARLDALDRALLALPPASSASRRATRSRTAGRHRRRSLEPDVGVVAAVPVDLDDRGIAGPAVSAAAGLAAAVVPALLLGHVLAGAGPPPRRAAAIALVRASASRLDLPVHGRGSRVGGRGRGPC